MAMTAKINLVNAPRNIAEIAKLGVFQQRQLAELLVQASVPVWSNDMEKTALLTASPEARSEKLAWGLQQYDAVNGAPQPMAQQPMQQPMQMPMTQMQMPMASQPGAQTEPPRQPSTEKGQKAPKAVDLKPVLDALEAQKKSVDALNATLQQVSAYLNASSEMSKVLLGLTYIIAQESTGAGGPDVLQGALDQCKEALSILNTPKG